MRKKPPDTDDVWQGTYHEEGATLYPGVGLRPPALPQELVRDARKGRHAGARRFPRATLGKYSGLVKHLRKTFEAMRDENRLFKRQIYGDNVDIDALVEALADARDGSEMSDRLFMRMHRTERNIAVECSWWT